MLFLPTNRYPGMSSVLGWVENHPETTTTENPCSPNVNGESSVLPTRHFAAVATVRTCKCGVRVTCRAVLPVVVNSELLRA